MVFQPDMGADLIRSLTGREPIMEIGQMTPDQLEELVRETIKAVTGDVTGAWETYQQEVDRRFDRLAKRLTELEHIAAQLRKDHQEDFERIARRMAESELAIRKHLHELLDAIDGQTEVMERLQAVIGAQQVGNFWQGRE